MPRKEITNRTKNLRWIDISTQTTQMREQLKNEFNFERIDLVDAFRQTYRSKIARRKDYIFLVLMVPVYKHHSRSIDIDEIDFFIGSDYIVTVHQGKLKPLRNLVRELQNAEFKADELMGNGIDDFLYHLLSEILSYTYPMADEIDSVLEQLKRDIFQSNRSRRVLVQEILRIRGNITELRKAMRGHETVIEELIKPEASTRLFNLNTKPTVFESLQDDAKELWASLESNKEMIEALEDANESLVSHSINEVMKTITLFSALLLPAALVASLFGMNAKNMPFIGHPLDFWIILLLLISMTLIILIIFWWKHWLK